MTVPLHVICSVVFFHFKQPLEICLGEVRKRRGTGRKSRIVTVQETMIYVPILKTLEVLLNNETVLTEVCCCSSA